MAMSEKTAARVEGRSRFRSIASGTPIIGTRNWEEVRAGGWEWTRNIRTSASGRGDGDYLYGLQQEHGEFNVTTGNAVDGSGEPRGIPGQIGVFVRPTPTPRRRWWHRKGRALNAIT